MAKTIDMFTFGEEGSRQRRWERCGEVEGRSRQAQAGCTGCEKICLILEFSCKTYVYLAWLRSGGSGESKCGARAGGEEKGRGVVARQVRGEKVFDCSLLLLCSRLSKCI